MLTILVPANELYNSELNEFIYTKETELHLEHSLLSISKWESKYHKAFLGKDERTIDETIDYIRFMNLDKKVDPNIFLVLSSNNIDEIAKYINDPMTATTFREHDRNRNREIITSEVIYYWMVTNNIPFECEKWHLNRLLTLIRVCGIKNSPQKKMSKNDTINYYKQLNEQRKATMNTKG